MKRTNFAIEFLSKWSKINDNLSQNHSTTANYPLNHSYIHFIQSSFNFNFIDTKEYHLSAPLVQLSTCHPRLNICPQDFILNQNIFLKLFKNGEKFY